MNELQDCQKNQTIISALKLIQKIHFAKNEPWKVKAYGKAWKAIENHNLPIKSTADAKKIPGIGSGIAGKIGIIAETGTHPILEEYNAKVKAVDELSQVHGIGPVIANEMINNGITTLAQLRTAVKNKNVELTSAQLIGLKYYEDFQEKIPYQEIKDIEAKMHDVSPKRTFIICGSHRRKKPFSGDIDVLLAGSSNHLNNFVKMLKKENIIVDDLSIGESKYMGVCKLTPDSKARRLDILYRPPECYWTAVSYFTGSKEHNINMRYAAMKKGWTLNEDGLFIDKGRKSGKITKGKRIEVKSEEHLFELLGMNYLLPEEREPNQNKDYTIDSEEKGEGDDKEGDDKEGDDEKGDDKEGDDGDDNVNANSEKEKKSSKSKDHNKKSSKESNKEVKEKYNMHSENKGGKLVMPTEFQNSEFVTESNSNLNFDSIPVHERQQLYDVNIGVLLAEDYYNKETGEAVVNPTGWYFSEKYDGVRAVWDGKSICSRTGNVYNTPPDFTKDFPNIPLDGELYIKPNFFNETSGLVRRKNAIDPLWDQVVFMVFDTPNMNIEFEDRYQILKNLNLKHPIKLVNHEMVQSPEQLQQIVQTLVDGGAEGGIIRKPKSYYIPTRSNTLLKVKKTHEEDAIVIGWEEGSGKNIGKLGALKIRWDNPLNIHKKYNTEVLPLQEFKVGSGFTNNQRYSLISDYTGRIPAEVQYPIGTKVIIRFPELQKSGKPRHPSFIGIRAEN